MWASGPAVRRCSVSFTCTSRKVGGRGCCRDGSAEVCLNAVSPLVETVAKAISQWMNGARLPSPPNWERLQEATRQAYREQAQAAIDACHVTEIETALRDLLEDTQHRNHQCGDTEVNCPVLKARAVLAKLDGKPTGQPV